MVVVVWVDVDVVGGCGGFFFFFSCCVVGFWWVVGFVVTVGIVMASGAENSWVEEKESDRGERDREREE